jgi:hypothetical protein
LHIRYNRITKGQALTWTFIPIFPILLVAPNL